MWGFSQPWICDASIAAAAALATMPALKLLDLSDNGLTGTLPADWSGASNLVMLLLDNNTFTGAHSLKQHHHNVMPSSQ